tara:strand:- start:1295 stop:4321 length:3027 start_codon:yes stop_codon:yes gene_type:complete
MFTSTRNLQKDVYVIPSTGGTPSRITYHSAADVGLDWSPDGREILFASNRQNGMSLYAIARTGGLARRMVHGLWNIAHSGAWSPKGDALLMGSSMEGAFFWWRKGYTGPNNDNIIHYNLKTKQATQLTHHKKNDVWPMWSKDGTSYFFVSERSGTANLYKASIQGGKKRALTTFKTGPVRWPSLSRDGRTIVYERHFQLWKTDTDTGRSERIPVSIQAANPHPQRTHTKLSSVQEYALSPDGKKLAFVMHGEIFVTDAKAKTAIHRVTRTHWREYSVTWDADSRHLLYLTERGKGFALVKRYPFSKKETQLVQSKTPLYFPTVSGDGQFIAYVKGKTDIMLLEKGKQPKLLAKTQHGGFMGWTLKWAPDHRWLMSIELDRGRGDIWLHHVDGKRSHKLTQTAAHDADGALSHDGKFLFYRSNPHGSDWFTRVGGDDLKLLPLKAMKRPFSEDRLEKLFKVKGKKKKTAKATSKKKKKASTKPATKTAKKKKKASKKTSKKKKTVKMVIDTFDILERTKTLTRLKGDERYPKPSPKGKRLLFFANTSGVVQIWMASFHAKKARISGAKPIALGLRFRHLWGDHGLRWASDGKAAYVLHRGKVVRIAIPSGKIQRLRLTTQIEIDHQQQRQQKFRELWLTMRDQFYDRGMSGLNWKQVYKRYLPAVQQVQTDEDWTDLMNEMVGELNASHLGVRLRRRGRALQTGSLGIEWRVVGKRVMITKILRRGALYNADRKLSAGAWLDSIDGETVTSSTSIHKLLEGKVGKRVVVVVKVPSKAKKVTWTKRSLKVRPMSYGADRWLRYLSWARARRKKVNAWSQGKIGYLHMRGMGQRDLYRLIRDFETQSRHAQAMIIDLRFNWGGNIHDRVLQILSRRLYSTWQIRGMKSWPQPFFAAAHKPMVMMINERSLSDAEMTANGFKALRLGKIVGVGTYRWLIFTTSSTLIDGTRFRLPFWACRTLDGKDLEKVGVSPDVYVRNTFSDRLLDKDVQLKKAVDVLMKQLKAPKKARK